MNLFALLWQLALRNARQSTPPPRQLPLLPDGQCAQCSMPYPHGELPGPVSPSPIQAPATHSTAHSCRRQRRPLHRPEWAACQRLSHCWRRRPHCPLTSHSCTPERPHTPGGATACVARAYQEQWVRLCERVGQGWSSANTPLEAAGLGITALLGATHADTCATTPQRQFCCRTLDVQACMPPLLTLHSP